MKCEILYEDHEILVIRKPAGLATQSAVVSQPDAVSELKGYLARENAKTQVKTPAKGEGGAPYLGIVHRLDQPVEGILVFAKTPKAAADLTRQLETGILNKRYYALVCGSPIPKSGELSDFMWKDRTNTARVVTGQEKAYPQAKPAKLSYETVAELCGEKQRIPFEGMISLLDICIATGRFHQIRAQLSHAGCPILGDRKYGNECSDRVSSLLQIKNAALCAYQLELSHPMSKEKLCWKIMPEEKVFGRILTGGGIWENGAGNGDIIL